LFADGHISFIDVDNREGAAEIILQDIQVVRQWARTWLVQSSSLKTESMIVSNKTRQEQHPPMDGWQRAERGQISISNRGMGDIIHEQISEINGKSI
jgi:hypothetical protein